MGALGDFLGESVQGLDYCLNGFFSGKRLSSWWFSFNPSEKYERQMGSLPQGFGVKTKIFELPPPSYCFSKELFHQQFQATIRFMVFDFQQNWVVEKCLGEFVLLELGKRKIIPAGKIHENSWKKTLPIQLTASLPPKKMDGNPEDFLCLSSFIEPADVHR